MTIPNSVTSIGKQAFAESGLISIDIPSSIKNIQENAFKNCMNLKSVTFEEGTKGIGDFAFTDCHHLTTLTIPESVTFMGYHAFIKTAVTDIYFGGNKEQWNKIEGVLYSGIEYDKAQIHFAKNTECTVTFNPNKGKAAPSSIVTEGGKLTELPVPERKGYHFKGWYMGKNKGKLVTTETVFTQDTKVFAKWKK